MGGMGSPAQQRLSKKFFDPFFNWKDDEKLREWLSQQSSDELEQFLNWSDFSTERDREILGRQELAKLRAPSVKHTEVVTLKPGIWGMSIDLKALWRRFVGQ